MIKASNNPFPHDPNDQYPDKLDRGGYIGSAKDLDDKISLVAFPDDFIVVGEIAKTGSTISIEPLTFQWRIDQVIFENENPFSTVIAPATEGHNRIDIIVATNFGAFIKIEGIESVDSAQEPPTPDNTLRVTFIAVFGSEITAPPLPIIGDNFVQKLEFWNTDVTLIGNAYVSFVIPISGIRYTGAVTEQSGVYLFSGYKAYPGKKFTIRNFQNIDLLLRHLGSVPDPGGINTKFFFPNGLDFVLKPGEIIEFSLNMTEKRFEYIGKLTDFQNYYTKPEIDSKISSVYKFKGNVANYAALPTTGLTIGDVYNLLDTGANFAWTGTVWDKLSDTVDISGKEDSTNKTDIVAGNENSTSKYLNIAGAVTYFQQKLTDSVFGAFNNSLTQKTTPIDADIISIVDSADGNKQKKVPLNNFKGYLKTWLDGLYDVPQITITTTVSITTDTLDASGNSQKGKHVIISNGVNAINITVNGVGSKPISYQKEGAGIITFVQASGRTLRLVNGTAVFNGAVGSTATVTSFGAIDSLLISNA
jgi:hypothetical protein